MTLRRDIGWALLVGLLAFAAAWSTIHIPMSNDATTHVETAYSFLLQGNADIDEYVGVEPSLDASRMPIQGHWYAPYTSGDALLMTPAAAVALALGVGPLSTGIATVLPKLVASLFVMVSVALVFLLVRRLVDRRVALYLTFAYAFGTGAFAAAQSYTEHPASLMLGAGSLLLALAGVPAGAGALAGLAVIVRPANVFLLLGIMAFLTRDGWASARRFALWTLPAAAFQTTIGMVAHENAFFTGGPVPVGSLAIGGIGLLISPSRGLLVYAPWLVVSLAALAASWRGRADRDRLLLRYGSLSFLGVWVLFGSYTDWWGGWTFGDRYLSDLSPLYALALADAWRRGWFARPLARAGLAVAIGWSVMLQTVGAGLYPYMWNGRHWDVTPNIDATPWRLWDWTDTQWQFVMRRLVTDPGPAMIVEGAFVIGVIACFALLSIRARRGSTWPGSTGAA